MCIESSSAIYASLSSELGSKGIKSLNNIKSSCDLIVSFQGVMNYSRVARVATENYGGPKKQSVQNNDGLKRYINARKHEYMRTRKLHELPIKNKNSKEISKYPVDKLDSRTKVYIDQLHSRLELAELRYSKLRKWQENYTRTNPLSISKVISKGAGEEGALQIEYDSVGSEVLNVARQGIQELLKLNEFIQSLEVEVQGNKKRLTLKRPAGDHVILTPQQFWSIERLLDIES